MRRDAVRPQSCVRIVAFAVDTIGLLLAVLITAASIQDRDAARPLLWNLRRAFPSVKLTWADGGYAGKLVTWAKTKLKPRLTLEIVKRPDDLHSFQVLPRREPQRRSRPRPRARPSLSPGTWSRRSATASSG